MIRRARWVLPIDRAPVEGGWVESHDGRVTRLGHGKPPGPAGDLGDVALLPGLVNAHTHVELSWMAGRVPPASSMNEWIRTLMQVRRHGVPGGRDEELAAARAAAAEMVATGTTLVGDVSNGLLTPRVLADAGLRGVVFHELLGFSHPDPVGAVRDAWERMSKTPGVVSSDAYRDATARAGGLIGSVVAHAPYSVSPALFRAIAVSRRGAPLSVHLAESVEEVEFLRTGRGPIRDMLEQLGVWTDFWEVPRCDPAEYLTGLGYLQPGTIVAHGVHLTDAGLDRLRDARAVIVTCPRSNVWVGTGPPRLSHFYASGVPVAIGTDSLASSPSLNLFDELAELRRFAPEVDAARLLESATRIGAEALGFGARFGTIAAGKDAALVAVDIPAGTTDVEEYLVSGVPRGSIRRARLHH
jgi:cytosine/adenosine deaminase-related metal-dependent hydrolase